MGPSRSLPLSNWPSAEDFTRRICRPIRAKSNEQLQQIRDQDEAETLRKLATFRGSLGAYCRCLKGVTAAPIRGTAIPEELSAMREAILIFRERSTELLPVEDNYKLLVGLSSCGSISEATLSGLDQGGFTSTRAQRCS
jgi:hypothetical protein